jgi:selenocysteine-specific elongation factor
LSGEDAALLETLVEEVARAGFDPPEWAKLDSLKGLSKPRAKVLADLAKVEPRLTSFGAGRYISSASLSRFKETVGELGRDGRKFKLADVRDGVGQSRRVVQPLLEYLDRVGFTRRIGDERILVGEANE